MLEFLRMESHLPSMLVSCIRTSTIGYSVKMHCTSMLPIRHCRPQIFQVGDQVMVRLRPERYAPGTTTKLHARSAGPFRVLSRIGENAYVVDIPHSWGISSTFNVADLALHQAPPLSSDGEPSSTGLFLRGRVCHGGPLPPFYHLIGMSESRRFFGR